MQSNYTVNVSPFVRALDITIIIAGFLGNSLVCAVFLSKSNAFHSTTNKLILHQSIIDLIAIIIFLIARVIVHPDVQEIPSGSISAQLFCKFWYNDFIMWGVFYASTFNLVLIAFERYAASCQLIWYRNFRLRGIAKFGFLAPWILGFGSQSYIVIFTYYTDGVCWVIWPAEAAQQVGGVIVFSFEFLFPIITMTWCYSKVILLLRKREKANRAVLRQDNILRRSKNVVTTLVTITIAYVVCWMPTEMMYLTFNLGLVVYYGGNVYYIFAVLTTLNFVVNPCIYTCKYKRFRNILRGLVCRLQWGRNEVSDIHPRLQQMRHIP
ncbi:galanin receptor type 1-like [Asterias rubens]|uniref:galanin receptor type 1-like n=1 Tax=Asterias rubens TaxID=7604 RepID=UPI0014553F11|nr:galanin receptor type 1-like [Asterias rubens]